MDESGKTSVYNSYLSFKLGNEYFAAHVNNVINILELTEITPVPKSPDFMKGVINLRGTVLPIIDTRLKFGMDQTQYGSNTCIIVLNVLIDDEQVSIGALVDNVQEVLKIDIEDIKPAPSIGNKYKPEFINGVIQWEDQFIMILDADRVFSVTEASDILEAISEEEASSVE
jgi:purine-binding chemotaxis protein CheW